MKVNIFGVGRSGTTALQLYVCYLLTKKYGQIYANSEPYNWLSRKGPVNYAGQQLFFADAILKQENEALSRRHVKFIQQLISHQAEMPVVTKFIRGIGCIDQINAIMEPDLNFVIVRDLFQVLFSIKRFQWDFTKLFFRPIASAQSVSFWDQFMVRAKALGLTDDLPVPVTDFTTIDDRNALFWYLSNKKALSYKNDNTIFVDQRKMTEVEEILQQAFCLAADEFIPIKHAIFFGNNLSYDYPLVDHNPKWKKVSQHVIRLLNYYNRLVLNVSYRTNLQLPFLPIRGGNQLVLSTSGTVSPRKKNSTKGQELNLTYPALMEQMNTEVMTALAAKRKKQIFA